MKIRLYMDEDSMQGAVIRTLKATGVDVIAAHDVGMDDKDDDKHLEYAKKANRVLCTFNVGDFYDLHTRLLKNEKHHAGMILVKQQEYSIGELTRRLLKLIATLSAEEMQDRAEFLSSWN